MVALCQREVVEVVDLVTTSTTTVVVEVAASPRTIYRSKIAWRYLVVVVVLDVVVGSSDPRSSRKPQTRMPCRQRRRYLQGGTST
jgi:hypothetical protein